MASPRPRVTAASCGVSRRGGSGSRIFWPERSGRSAEKATSSSRMPATARTQPATARLNGSVGPSRFFPTLDTALDLSSTLSCGPHGRGSLQDRNRLRPLIQPALALSCSHHSWNADMAEPESHTLRLLREFRQEFAEYRKEF